MGKNSSIAWTHHSFNPWWGCEKPLVQIGGKTVVSPECVNCYAETYDRARGGPTKPHWGRTAPRRCFGDKHWRDPLKWDREAAAAGERHRVFCLSMGDILEDRRDLDPQRARLWPIMRDTPNLDWLLLTKRADNLETLVPDWVWQLPNVWPGVTAGTQPMADLRIPPLLRLKARFPHLVAWVSFEPLLGPINVRRVMWGDCQYDALTHGLNNDMKALPRLDWGVIGLECGVKARPGDVAAGRALLEQFQGAGMPVFWKQFGARPRERIPAADGWYYPQFRDRAGADPTEWPDWAKVQEFPR